MIHLGDISVPGLLERFWRMQATSCRCRSCRSRCCLSRQAWEPQLDGDGHPGLPPPPKKKMFPQGLLNLKMPRFFIFFCVAWPFFLGFYESQVPGRWKEKPPCCRWSLWSRCARWEVFKGRKTSWSSSGILDLSCRILDQEFINADLFIVIKWYQVLFFQYTSCWFKNFPAWQIKLFIYFFFCLFCCAGKKKLRAVAGHLDHRQDPTFLHGTLTHNHHPTGGEFAKMALNLALSVRANVGSLGFRGYGTG